MTLRRLLAFAALLHLSATLALFLAGRAGIAPQIVNRDGIVTAAAVDSVSYQQDALQHAAAPLHVRILAPLFAIFGTSILAAEPFNLLCYLAIVGLTFAIGREVGGARAALVVALWPTLLLHTTQFLKDPLFIAGTLALIFIVTTWLTMTFDGRRAAIAAALVLGAAALLLLIRAKFAVAILAIVTCAGVLLVVRQLAERRLLVWNTICALVTLAAAVLLFVESSRTLERVKMVPSPVRGASKSAAAPRMATVVVWGAPVDRTSLALSTARERYVLSDTLSGSGIDDTVSPRGIRGWLAYVPRAAAIGLWAPFPAMWLRPGGAVGTVGRAVAGVETLAMYIIELLALVAVAMKPRRLSAIFLVLIATFGVTLLALVVTNAGTLYRFRYPFWILLIVAGASGAAKLVRVRRSAAVAVLACLALGCHATDAKTKTLAITNLSGRTIDALYLSPTEASTWEENVLGVEVLRDGETVNVRFDPRAMPQLWDLRADSGGYRAEWLRLDRSRVHAIALRTAKGVAVAELR